MNLRHISIAFFATHIVLLWCAGAQASPTFPDVVKSKLQLGDAPSCILCHTSPSGGLGTANTPVGEYLRSRGLVAKDTDALGVALSAMVGENHDADADGVADASELTMGTDPNGGADADPNLPPVSYGCQVAVDSSHVVKHGWLFMMLIVGLATLRILGQSRR